MKTDSRVVLTLTADEFAKYLVYKRIFSYTRNLGGLVEAKIDITPEEYLEYNKYLEMNPNLGPMGQMILRKLYPSY